MNNKPLQKILPHPLDEEGCRIQAVNFVYPSETEPDAPHAAVEALEAMQRGLLIVICVGHADGARVRACALARLVGLYDSDTAAAKVLGVNRRTMSRAVARMRSEIQRVSRLSQLLANVPHKNPFNK